MNQGVNILWVSKMLGHKDFSTTLQAYTKFIEEGEDKRLENLANMAH
jgi:integrase